MTEIPSRNLEADVRPRESWGWMMFDFANSGYTTVVITAVFNAYFVGVVAGKEVWATFAWTLALSISYALIVISAPLIGAHADAHAARKRLLALTTIGCVAATAWPWWVPAISRWASCCWWFRTFSSARGKT